MALDELGILDRINDSREKRRGFEARAAKDEAIWRLKLWGESQEAMHAQGKEQVTLPEPANAVRLAESLIRKHPQIGVPPEYDVDPKDPEALEKSDLSRRKRRRFLNSAWVQSARQQKKNLVAHAWWMQLVRSRTVFAPRWVGSNFKGPMAKQFLPFHIGVLDPLKCGFHHGPYYTEWAFYESDVDEWQIRQDYRDVEIPEKKERVRFNPLTGKDEEDEDFTKRSVVEFWHMDDFQVYRSLLIEDELVIEPEHQPMYFQVPLIEVLGEDFPIDDEADKAHSFLRPMADIWANMSRLTSQIGTGQLLYFWPQAVIEGDEPVDIANFGPGNEPLQVPMGTKVTYPRVDANTPISDRLMGVYETQMERSSFPSSLYGISGGTMAGHTLSALHAAARSRVNKPLNNLELGISNVNSTLLYMIEKHGKPVGIWGAEAFQDLDGSQYYTVELTAADINGVYGSEVSLEPELASDTAAQDALAVRLHDSHVASAATTRDKLSWDFPEDESQRIIQEQEEMTIAAAQQQGIATVIQAKVQEALEQERMAMAQQMQAQQMPQGGGMPGMPGMGPVTQGNTNGLPGPTPGPAPLQPEAMMGGLASTQAEGQMMPIDMGADPIAFRDMMNSQSNQQMLNANNPNKAKEGR